MAGGTLAVSRAVHNHSYYQKRLETLGFRNPAITASEKDGLNSMIDNMKPDLMLMDARFYQCATPYMMSIIQKHFPKLNMAVVCIGDYPADLGMYFILNGVKGYVTTFDGLDQFYTALNDIRDGKEYIPETVQHRIDERTARPAGARCLTKITTEVLRCLCNGYSHDEIADNLAISPRTVETHRREIFRSLNVRNGAGLVKAALAIGVITSDELVFRHGDYRCTPLPKDDKKMMRRKT